jgi:hypothetical protein
VRLLPYNQQNDDRGKMGFKIRSLFGSDKDTGKQKELSEQEVTMTTQDKPEEVAAIPSADQEEGKVTGAPDEEKEAFEPQPVTLLEVEEPQRGVTEQPVASADTPQEQEDEEEKAPLRRERFKPRNVEELLMTAVPERAHQASSNLKAILCKTVLVELVPSGKKYLFDPTHEGGPTVKQSPAVETACTLQLHEKDLMKIAEGNLNPQVLMLSHKAKVWGDPQVATHFFTLIAPPSSL